MVNLVCRVDRMKNKVLAIAALCSFSSLINPQVGVGQIQSLSQSGWSEYSTSAGSYQFASQPANTQIGANDALIITSEGYNVLNGTPGHVISIASTNKIITGSPVRCSFTVTNSGYTPIVTIAKKAAKAAVITFPLGANNYLNVNVSTLDPRTCTELGASTFTNISVAPNDNNHVLRTAQLNNDGSKLLVSAWDGAAGYAKALLIDANTFQLLNSSANNSVLIPSSNLEVAVDMSFQKLYQPILGTSYQSPGMVNLPSSGFMRDFSFAPQSARLFASYGQDGATVFSSVIQPGIQNSPSAIWIPTPAGAFSTGAVAISSNGRYGAFTTTQNLGSFDYKLQIIDLINSQSPTQIFEYLFTASQFRTAKMLFTPDGSHLVVMRGGSSPVGENLLIFQKDLNTNTYSAASVQRLDGNLQTLDMSIDGRKISISSASAIAYDRSGLTFNIDLGSDLLGIGKDITSVIEKASAPNKLCTLIRGNGPLPSPVSFGLGNIWLTSPSAMASTYSNQNSVCTFNLTAEQQATLVSGKALQGIQERNRDLLTKSVIAIP